MAQVVTQPRSPPPGKRVVYQPSSKPGARGTKAEKELTDSSRTKAGTGAVGASDRRQRILHSTAHAELDPLIHQLLSLISRWFILTWYSGISRDPDRTFVRQVDAILVHVIQALEVRLAQVDLVQLAAVDLPLLLEAHIRDFEESEARTAESSHAHANDLDRDDMFDRIQSHIAVSLVDVAPTSSLADGASTSPTSKRRKANVDKVYLRALVDNLLRLLLPPEDYRAETERTIVREILVNIVLGNVFEKVAQPWFLHMMIAKVIEGTQESNSSKALPPRQTRKTEGSKTTAPPPPPTSIPEMLVLMLRRAWDTVGSLPTFFRALAVSISALYNTAISAPVPPHFRDRPPLTTPTLTLLVALLPSSPLVDQVVHYAQLLLALVSSFVTSLVFYVLTERIFTPNLTKTVLQVAQNALFPNGRPSPKEPDPTPDEQVALKERCEKRVAEVLPSRLGQALYSPRVPDRSLALARHILDPLSSHVANVHLFILILDLVLGKVFPELVIQDDS
ncbi:hypothetical protein T439DRAFT_295899 [Meredithblackwellia eburnea MCA 4105]